MRTSILSLLLLLVILAGCSPSGRHTLSHRSAEIYPGYAGTVIPYNIAPLNFAIREGATKYRVRFIAGADSFSISCRQTVDIPLLKWRKLLAAHRGERLIVRISARRPGGWETFSDLLFTISPEAIDPYLAYRLIEPGYTTWGKMGLYQRNLENFDEQPIVTNDLVDDACINCHSFRQNDPSTMLFHVRKVNPGTVFLRDGQLSRVNTQTANMISAGVYPRWHPGGRYVAFSTNTTRQNFHSVHTNKVEVYDMASDIVVYDTQTNRIFSAPQLNSPNHFETFPEWSPDGAYLYYCTAPARPMPAQYDSLRYDLARLRFDADAARFASAADTLVRASLTGQSVALARVSPDNRFVVFCLSHFGTFPIWHRENDLYILRLSDGTVRPMTEINSPESDSYHSFSSNGRWLVFSSRRADGAYTRPYISYLDPNGTPSPPFLLPQKNPEFYDLSFKSFNIPELITGPVDVSPTRFARAVRNPSLRQAQ
ncbi:MAG: hypothetical protein LBS05_03320 [Tannerellaceae bacterium]|jgi:hypothetical protein|nr:hypothetical protein [Tannerellaceae bacterium]